MVMMNVSFGTKIAEHAGTSVKAGRASAPCSRTCCRLSSSHSPLFALTRHNLPTGLSVLRLDYRAWTATRSAVMIFLTILALLWEIFLFSSSPNP